LRAATIDHVRTHWERHGTLDSAWTAAATACLLMEDSRHP
jgi:hypothetical protein